MAPHPKRPEPRDREVGTVLSVTSTGLVTVRCPGARAPNEGTPIVDRSGRLLGRVARVFGPVARPFVSVRPRSPLRAAESAALIGSSVREG